jgi:hypothetical protein
MNHDRSVAGKSCRAPKVGEHPATKQHADIEAVESRFLPGRSRHSSAQGGARKPVAAEGARLATSRGRGAQPIRYAYLESSDA